MGFCTSAEYEEFFRSVIMLERSHIPEARWWVVHAVDNKRARLDCVGHLLKQFPYREVQKPPVVLPERERHEHYWGRRCRPRCSCPRCTEA